MTPIKLAVETRKSGIKANVKIIKLLFCKLMLHMTEVNLPLKTLISCITALRLCLSTNCLTFMTLKFQWWWLIIIINIKVNVFFPTIFGLHIFFYIPSLLLPREKVISQSYWFNFQKLNLLVINLKQLVIYFVLLWKTGRSIGKLRRELIELNYLCLSWLFPQGSME